MKTLFLPNTSIRLMLLAILCLCPFIGVQAATLTVCASGCDFTDVQAAIDAAQPGDTVQIGSGEYPANLIISKNIILQGQGMDKTILSGGSNPGYKIVVTVLPGAFVELHKLSIRGGFGKDMGAGISNNGSLKLVDCSILDNKAIVGAGIYNVGELVVENCDITGNQGSNGSAIYNERTARIINSAIHNNNSFFSILENARTYAYLSITNSTVSDNQGSDFYTIFGGVFDLDGVTVVAAKINTDSNLFSLPSGALFRIASSIISGNPSSSNCLFAGNLTVTSFGNNVSSDDTCQLVNSTDRQNAKNINLDPLQIVGSGPIPLHPLLPGSVAIDFAPNGSSLCNAVVAPKDQRGVSKPQGDGCDSGAYELQVPVAHDDTYATTEGQALVSPMPNLLANDVSPDLPIKFEGASAVSHGLLYTNADGSFKYIPEAGFSGQDGFTYTVTDGVHSSNPATVTITVQHINHPPVANNDNYVAIADHPLAVTAVQGVLANDSDPDGDTMSALLSDCLYMVR